MNVKMRHLLHFQLIVENQFHTLDRNSTARKDHLQVFADFGAMRQR